MKILTDILELDGMTSEWAENGQKAVKVFSGSEPGHFDFILIDMRMPVMDGLTTSKEIRSLDREDAGKSPDNSPYRERVRRRRSGVSQRRNKRASVKAGRLGSSGGHDEAAPFRIMKKDLRWPARASQILFKSEKRAPPGRP